MGELHFKYSTESLHAPPDSPVSAIGDVPGLSALGQRIRGMLLGKGEESLVGVGRTLLELLGLLEDVRLVEYNLFQSDGRFHQSHEMGDSASTYTVSIGRIPISDHASHYVLLIRGSQQGNLPMQRSLHGLFVGSANMVTEEGRTSNGVVADVGMNPWGHPDSSLVAEQSKVLNGRSGALNRCAFAHLMVGLLRAGAVNG